MKDNNDIRLSRRGFISGLVALSAIGGIGSLLTSSPLIRRAVLDAASRWNDTAQGALFSPKHLAQTYNESDISEAFPYNGFYPEAYTPLINATSWVLDLAGEVNRREPLTFSELYAMPQKSQITRLICIEGWSAVGQWSGVPLRCVLEVIGANMQAHSVRFDCADGYYTSIDMASAIHPQTILALDFLGQPLPRSFGAPVRLRIPTKLGFKNAKFITKISVHNNKQGGYWEDKGYNGFSGL